MAPSGIIYVGSHITDPTLSQDLLNRWYYETHFPEIFAIPNGPNLALVDSPEFTNAKYTHDLLPKSHLELAEFDIRYNQKVRTLEDQISRDGRIGECLVAIDIDSDKGDEAEKDFDAWYHLQQADMLSVITEYRRTTCYKLKDSPSFSATN